jgi:glyoxylase-like metal-dependent hydrolase (beta-lactamase superfamily II)
MPECLNPVHILDTGYCLAREATIMRGGRQKVVECHCLVALLRHPEQGWVLWDTGYAPRMLEETRRLPYRLYRYATPLRIGPEGAVVSQLSGLGLSARDVRTVVLSHFHADHLSGLRDFPDARIVTTASAWEGVRSLSGFAALRRGFLPGLVPGDFEARATLLPPFTGPSIGGLGPSHDLLGDGTLQLVDLPGHARGHFGLLARTEQCETLLCADGAWMRQAIRERRPPSRSTHFFMDDPRVAADTLDRLHAFGQENPQVLLVPTHCPEACRELVRGARC